MGHDTPHPRARHDGDTGASLVHALLIALSALADFGREDGDSLDGSGQSTVQVTG